MARITARRLMAAHALSGLRSRLDGVTHHEITAMYLLRLRLFGHPLLSRERLSQIVTRLAVTLTVTALTELLLSHGLSAMLTQKRWAVLQESDRQGLPQVALFVARR